MSSAAEAIFRVPPFPGARPAPITHNRRQGTPAPAAHVIAALREGRVGGAFWAPDDLWSALEHLVQAPGDDPHLLLAAIAGKSVQASSDGAFAALSALPPGNAETEKLIEELVTRHLLETTDFADPFTGEATPVLALIQTLAGWRRLIDANRPIAAAFGFAHWKRDTVDPLLWAGKPVPFRTASSDALKTLPHGATIAAWKARIPAAILAEIESGPWHVTEIEDGFIRSTGLGADCVPPLSIVVDDLGVHYDPLRPNRLEEMLAQNDFAPDMLVRARALRDWLVREGVSKYGVGTGAAPLRPGGSKPHILVVGQVEDDRSVLFGSTDVRSNLDLLRRVRASAPEAYLVYRPHPDVEAGHRKGAIPAAAVRMLADLIDPASPISALIAMVDEVHVMTSLAGFEALLQCKEVTTHGMPFFAGWGLTRDLAAPPARRGRVRTLDDLVAAVLLTYPRYLDPVTNLPCTAEIMVMRLLSGVRRQNNALVPMRRFFGWMKRATKQMLSGK
jgi:capsular polysaccharide export protein